MTTQPVLTDLRTLPIEELNFSVRLYNCLKRESIHTLGDLLERSEEQLLGIYGMTGREVYEARDLLELVNQCCGTDLQLKPGTPQPNFLPSLSE